VTECASGAAAAELPALQDIERAAGLAFRSVGMPEIADDEAAVPGRAHGYQQAAGPG